MAMINWGRSNVLGFLLVLQWFIVSVTRAHMVSVGASTKECFFEDLHVNDKVKLLVNHLEYLRETDYNGK